VWFDRRDANSTLHTTLTVPRLGRYSSHDRAVLRAHIELLRYAGVDGVLLMWDPPNRTASAFTD
jgi:hypothetical protein